LGIEVVKHYRTIYVVQPTHDLSDTRDFTNNLRFITNGNELVENLLPVIRESLKDFDPDQDAILAMGRVSANVLVGMILREKFPSKLIDLGIRNNESYQFIELEID
jgi:hypothetical protein